MDSSTGVQSSLELESLKALTQLTDADKRKVLEYIESLILLEGTNNENGQRNAQQN
jgi:hypothetical protein